MHFICSHINIAYAAYLTKAKIPFKSKYIPILNKFTELGLINS